MTATRPGLPRLLHIVVVVCRHAAAHGFDLLAGRMAALLHRPRQPPMPGPIRFRTALEDLGGSFIKLGQMLALQPDILSLEYCDALFTLLDRVKPFGYEQVRRTFEEEFGQGPEHLFDSFVRQPLATASIGQVHIAWLHGRKLAVKVQRPSVQFDFAGDIGLITLLTRTIRRGRIARLYWLLEPLEEFVAWSAEELDYRIEARYMERLRHNAEDRSVERIPEVLGRFTTRRTLVTEFLDGVTVLACLRAREAQSATMMPQLPAGAVDTHEVARNIIDNFLASVFRHGMFHADLHPANLLVLSGNAIGYIDFGITGVIGGYSRRNLVSLTLAYTSGDLEGMAEAFFRVCHMTNERSPHAFRRGLRELESSWYEHADGRCRLRKNFTMVMLDMLRLSRRCGVWPDRDVIKYIRSAIAIDGLITRLAPDFEVTQYLATVCAEHLRWHMRRTLLTYDALVDVTSAGGRMMRDGLARGTAAIGRIAGGGPTAQLQLRHLRPDGAERWALDSVALGVIAFGAAVLGSMSPERAPGFNLFTAANAVVLMAAARLARMVWRVAATAGSSGHVTTGKGVHHA